MKRAVAESASNELIAVAYGLGMESRRSSVVVRDREGRVLDEGARFFSLDGLDTNFLKTENIPSAERAGAIERNWLAMLKAMRAAGPPEFVSFGHSDVEIVKLRVSRRFREDVLLPQLKPHPFISRYEPMLFHSPENAVWLGASDVAPQRAQSRRVARHVGFARGYRNYLDYEVEGKYVPLRAGEQITLSLQGLKPSLYSLYFYGTIARDGRRKLPRVWRPVPLRFELRDAGGQVLTRGAGCSSRAFRRAECKVSRSTSKKRATTPPLFNWKTERWRRLKLPMSRF